MVLLAPVFVVLLFGIIWVGRYVLAEGAMDEVARNAARAASLGPTAAIGLANARAAAEQSVAEQGLRCAGPNLDVDTRGFAAPIGQPVRVMVTVGCPIANADLAFPGVPGEVFLSATFTSPIDSYRSR